MLFIIFCVFIYFVIVGLVAAAAAKCGLEDDCMLIGAVWPLSVPLIAGLRIGRKLFRVGK